VNELQFRDPQLARSLAATLALVVDTGVDSEALRASLFRVGGPAPDPAPSGPPRNEKTPAALAGVVARLQRSSLSWRSA